MLRLTFLVGGLSLLMLVGWLGFLRADEVTESNMIVFVSDRSGGASELYLMAADGSGVRRIVRDDGVHRYIDNPIWSPNGNWIAYAWHDFDGNVEIYRVRPNGTGLQLVLSDRITLELSSWSPDSQRIALSDGFHVYTLHVESGDIRQLTWDGNNVSPQWSPDGEWIVFRRKTLDSRTFHNIARMRSDGSDLQILTPAAFYDRDANYSPDGERIIFRSNFDMGPSIMYGSMRPDGTDLALLDGPYTNRVADRPMNWSASGEWGLDSWEGDLGSDIFRFRADESELIRLTFNKAWDLFPAWSPPISLAWRGWINAFVGFALLLVWIAPAVRR